jgi:dimethylhistidine N-methyltransferase
MLAAQAKAVEFYDFHPEVADFRAEALRGLRGRPKSLSPKFFYDQRGSELFDRICELEEYYPTRAEIEILESHAAEIAALLGYDCTLIEYGSGSSRKVRSLLDAFDGQPIYAAIDISKEHLLHSAQELSWSYPELDVVAICADYTKPFDLPWRLRSSRNKAVFFPGSTIGNFTPGEARRFLRETANLLQPRGSLLIGVDLKKNPEVLDAAYNDAAGVTAAFNKNLLRRMNLELGADFDLSSFRHHAFYNQPAERVEMHLVSLRDQCVRFDGAWIDFERGESIHTENSYKFDVASFQSLAEEAGFRAERVWSDPRGLFSLHYLTVGRGHAEAA